MKALVKQTVKQTDNRAVSRSLKQLEPELEPEVYPSYSYPANRPALRGDQSRLAARIAAVQLDRLDELTLLGYPALDPATREVYEVALRLAARKVLES